METQRHLNTFQKGQVQDIDKLQLGKESYLYSLGGRVIFNEDGTYAWENAKGTKFAFTISANYGTATNYVPNGGVELNGMLVVFSCQDGGGAGKHSEIGLVTENEYGVFVYQTMYNDLYDPFQQLLGLSVAHPMRDLKVVLENSVTQNVYFNDYFNEPRVFNIQLGTVLYTDGVTTWFATPADYYKPQPDAPITPASRYPNFYSVHSMAQMIDLTWGLLKFVKTISGELLTGSYQYAYRYIDQTGYASPWSPVSGQVFVNINTPSNANWTGYQMLNSNVQTTKGNLLELDFLDTRFQQVEVAALYWETDAAPTSAYTFFKANIPANGTLQVQHQFTGSAIPVSSLVQTYTEISKLKTGGLKDNQRNVANYSIFPLLELDTSLITVAPFKRNMLADNTQNVKTIPFTNQGLTTNDSITVNGADGLPIPYTIDGTPGDYISYKGVQMACQFRGRFGGEIYPYAIVLFDRKGQAFFAQHISDFSMPQRYGNQCSDNRLSGQVVETFGNPGDWNHTSQSGAGLSVTDKQNTTNFTLNILGLKFSGIYIPDNILYDANGLLQVSGFSIVDAGRVKQILAQGLILSGTSANSYSADNSNSKTVNQGNFGDDIDQVTPLSTSFNGFVAWQNGFPGAPHPTYQGVLQYSGGAEDYHNGATNNDTYYVGFSPGNVGYCTGTNGPPLPFYKPVVVSHILADQDVNVGSCSARQQLGFFDAPDFMINNAIVGDAAVTGDCLQLVNICTTSYNGTGSVTSVGGANPLSMNDAAPQELNYQGTSGNHQSYYQKNYRSVLSSDPNTLTPDQNNTGVFTGQTNLGDRLLINTTPQGWFPNVQEGQVVFNTITYDNHPRVVNYLNVDWGDNRYFAYQRKPTILFAASNAQSVNGGNYTPNMVGVLTDGGNGHTAYFIGNYVRPVGNYTITLPLLQNRTYQPIGHFVPINPAIIATMKGLNGGKCIFNNVEVWGGDCFMDYFSYLRLYSDMGEVNGNNLIDYTFGLSFPVESVFNIALRFGNTYEALGPENSAQFNNNNGGFPNGLYYDSATNLKLEDFNENVVLDAWTTQTFAYASKPSTFKPIYDFPVNEICTGVKIYGELYDTFRLFPINNLQSADGSKGQINSMQYIFDNLYIIQESGMARVRFNDRTTTSTPDGTAIVLNSNTGYQGHDYNDIVFGTQHQFSVINTGKALHYIDGNKGKMMTFAGQRPVPTSDIYGEHSFFTFVSRKYWGNDNPVGGIGILGVADFKNQSVYYTFSQIGVPDGPTPYYSGSTIEFSEASAQFKGFHPYVPKIYFNLRQNFFSTDPANPQNVHAMDEGLRGWYYTQFINSKLKFVVNPALTTPQWYYNQRISMNSQAASTKMYSFTGICADLPVQTLVFPTDLVPGETYTQWRYVKGIMAFKTRSQTAASFLIGTSMITEYEVVNDASDTVVRISAVETIHDTYPSMGNGAG